MKLFPLQNNGDWQGEAATRLEAQLRAAAPILPPALRSRTLMHCARERETMRRNRRRGQKRWAWTLAGLCLFHWGAMSYFDAQSAALINGQTPPPLVASATTDVAALRVALQAHTHLFAALGESRGHIAALARDAG